jgi:pimeloyl-ACP methyl ester carboxylesterase
MRILKVVTPLLLAVLASSTAAHAQQQPDVLKRRAVFGGQVMPHEGGGVTLGQLAPGLAAEAAGLRPGDVITMAGGRTFANPQEFVAALKTFGAGPVKMTVVRDGETSEREVVLREMPRETSPDYDVVYDSVRANDALRRTIITRPRGAGRRPAVLFAGGIGCYSLDGAPAVVDGYIGIIQELTRRGFVVMRVEKSGMGDSLGVPCEAQDFNNELAGYRAGFQKLRTYDYVDAANVFLVGHSIGGLVAPILGAELPFRGLVAMSTAGQKWIDYENVNARRQFVMEGNQGEVLEAKLKEREKCARQFLLGKGTPDEGCGEHVQYPASRAYMQQVAALDVAALWSKVKAPVLLIHGTSDFVTDAEEHKRIVKAAANATLLLEPNMDHFLREVPSMQASMDGLKSNAMQSTPMQTRVRDDIAKWLLSNVKKPAR